MTSEPSPNANVPTLLIFAREPVAGQVKTRLAATIGAEAAALAYRELTDATLAYAVAARAQGIVASVALWCTPDPASPYFRELASRHRMAPHRQSEGDLGDRMSGAIRAALTGAPAALLIGTDCPALGVAGLGAAATLLRNHDAVLGPAEDGGFVLVGARNCVSFGGVRWGNPHTLQDTRAAFARSGVRWAELPVSWDVDEPADLARWKALRAG